MNNKNLGYPWNDNDGDSSFLGEGFNQRKGNEIIEIIHSSNNLRLN